MYKDLAPQELEVLVEELLNDFEEEFELEPVALKQKFETRNHSDKTMLYYRASELYDNALSYKEIIQNLV